MNGIELDFLDSLRGEELRNTTKANIERLTEFGFTFGIGDESNLFYDFDVVENTYLQVIIAALDNSHISYTAFLNTKPDAFFTAKLIYKGQNFEEMLEELIN